MRHLRRAIAMLVGCAAWCIVATTVAHAAMLHDPVPAASVVVPPNGKRLEHRSGRVQPLRCLGFSWFLP